MPIPIPVVDSIISAVISPGSGHAISGSFGLIFGASLGAYLKSITANSAKNKLLIKLKHLLKERTENNKENFSTILETLLQQLDALDLDQKLKLELGKNIRPFMENYCYLAADADTGLYRVLQLHEGIKTTEQDSTSTYDIEKTIDEYFETYLKVNRKEINTANRAAAVATVQLMRNTSIILIQLMKLVASLPGYENETRLEKFKDLIRDYFTNLLSNDHLVNNISKNLLDYLINPTTQRETLATKVQDHYIQLNDQLIVEQRNISIQQLANYSYRHLHSLIGNFLEIVARLFDNEAAKEFTEITIHKMTHGMLRADSSQSTGILPFASKGICQLLQPLAAIAESLNQMSYREDLVSFVRYQDILSKPEIIQAISAWSAKHQFRKIPLDAQQLITQDIIHICKLLFICQALEKNFMQNAAQHGLQGMVERGEYQSKRAVILILYEEAMKRLQLFFSRHKEVAELIQLMNEPEWLEKQKLPKTGNSHSFVVKTGSTDKRSFTSLTRMVTNSVLYERLSSLNLLRTKMDYTHNAFMDSHYVEGAHQSREDFPLDKDTKTYLFNISRVMQEFDLHQALGINFSDRKKNASLNRKDLLGFMQMTQFQLQYTAESLHKLSGKLTLSTKYMPTKLTQGQIISYQVSFGEHCLEIEQSFYQFLKRIELDNVKWSPVPHNLLAQEDQLTLQVASDCNLQAYIHSYGQLRKLYEHLNKDGRVQNNAALKSFLENLEQPLKDMQGLIEDIHIEEETIKYLAANNKRLTTNSQAQKQTIVSLNNDVQSLSTNLHKARENIDQLYQTSQDNLEKIRTMEQSNERIYQLLLDEFRTNIKELKALNSTLNHKLGDIEKMLQGHNDGKNQVASEEITRLKNDMRSRFDYLLQRLEHYEEIFVQANEESKKAFFELKKGIDKQQLLITQLENQLSTALQQLEEQRKKTDFFVARNGRPHLIVNDFPTLFKHLETVHKPRLNFFSSYRSVKTGNLLTFIEILLANQRFLHQSISQYRNLRAFHQMIDECLDNSEVINAYHGLVNTSISKAVFKSIIHSFEQGQLVEQLKVGGIPYHDGYIKLNMNGKLIYKEECIPCPIQPN